MGDYQPTDRELEALKVLWEMGEATVRQIFDSLSAAGEELAYTTVLSLLQVMEQKELVTHRREGKAYVYQPNIERTKTFRDLASTFLDKVFDGSLDEYLVHAIGSRRISAAELDKIEAMIDLARSKSKSKRKKGGQ